MRGPAGLFGIGVLTVLLVGAGSAHAAKPSCPANTTNDVYVNPSPKVKRQKNVALTGVSSPVNCTFASITTAIDSAETRGLGAGARIILTGATASVPAAFTNEAYPLDVPAGLTITTSDDPALGGAGLNAAHYLVRFGGSAATALAVHGGGVKGISVTNARTVAATRMVACDGGTNVFDAVTLDGQGSAASVGTGLDLSSLCVFDANGVRVRNLGGTGVIAGAGTDLDMDNSKVYGNGGDGLALSGATSLSNSIVAFNGDDGVLANSTASADFTGNDVRDNVGNGFEVHAVDSSFASNVIHNNSRSAGWGEPQLLFSGDGAPDTFGIPGECVVIPSPCFNFDFQGSASDVCADQLANGIWSYNTSDVGNFNSVGVRAVNGAHVWAGLNFWRSASVSENVTADPGSFVAVGTMCGTRAVADPDPPPPVE